MNYPRLKSSAGIAVPVAILIATVLVPLRVIDSALKDASGLEAMYAWLIWVNAAGSFLLLVLLAANVYSLMRRFKKRAAGSRLTLRMVLLFVCLALLPAWIVFYYSMQIFPRSMDSWFQTQINRAMQDALELGQASLDQRMRGLLQRAEYTAQVLENTADSQIPVELDDLRNNAGASELTLWSRQGRGRIIASSHVDPGLVFPSPPDESVILQLRQGKSYVGLEPAAGQGMQVRVLVPADAAHTRYLQALFPVPVRLGRLAETVADAYAQYQAMNDLRSSLKQSFSLALTLVLLSSMLGAIWVAFYLIRRIVAPVRDLVRATRAVAAGNYEQQLPVLRRDDLGFLVESFNDMTQRIAWARDEAQRSREEVETQKAYLETVLGNLSSGVLSFDGLLQLRTANHAADQILHADISAYAGKSLYVFAEAHPNLAALVEMLQEKLAYSESPWQREISFLGPNGRQQLLWRGTPLVSSTGSRCGAVMVFDDVTALIQAQRNAAWGEVARRLAHEVKNPLTPIQLSAERLKRKLRSKLDPDDVEMLDRSIRTIVQQVEAMKTMVNSFSEYARPRKIRFALLDIATLIEEVAHLYASQTGTEIRLVLGDGLFEVEGDAVRLRQVLHNLIKNAQEAVDSTRTAEIEISVRPTREQGCSYVEIGIRDNGPGVPEDLADGIFEPYVTTKTKGTGLGLAIVKKIVEEHGGLIYLDSEYRQGAGFVIRLPLVTGRDAGDDAVSEALERRQTT